MPYEKYLNGSKVGSFFLHIILEYQNLGHHHYFLLLAGESSGLVEDK